MNYRHVYNKIEYNNCQDCGSEIANYSYANFNKTSAIEVGDSKYLYENELEKYPVFSWVYEWL